MYSLIDKDFKIIKIRNIITKCLIIKNKKIDEWMILIIGYVNVFFILLILCHFTNIDIIT